VKTGFQQNVLAGAPPELTGLRKQWAITPEHCARAIADGLERNKRTVVTPATGWLLIAASRMFPGIVENVLANTNEKQYGGIHPGKRQA
jgi:short-subunit dehydrogenase